MSRQGVGRQRNFGSLSGEEILVSSEMSGIFGVHSAFYSVGIKFLSLRLKKVGGDIGQDRRLVPRLRIVEL